MSYFIGTYVPVADGGPRFVPSAPFNHTTSMKSESGDLMGPNRVLGGGLSTMKTSSVGSNNVMNASSRRVYFGTIELHPLTILNPAPDENTTHSNYIVSLPRDLSLLVLSDGTPVPRVCIRARAFRFARGEFAPSVAAGRPHGRKARV